MVIKEPTKRIKIKNIIQHEWLKSIQIRNHLRKRRSTLQLRNVIKDEDSKSSGKKYVYGRISTPKIISDMENLHNNVH